MTKGNLITNLSLGLFSVQVSCQVCSFYIKKKKGSTSWPEREGLSSFLIGNFPILITFRDRRAIAQSRSLKATTMSWVQERICPDESPLDLSINRLFPMGLPISKVEILTPTNGDTRKGHFRKGTGLWRNSRLCQEASGDESFSQDLVEKGTHCTGVEEMRKTTHRDVQAVRYP